MSLNNAFIQEINQKLKITNKKLLFIFDLDQTLVDTYHSVLIPTFNSLNIDYSTLDEFSNRKGMFKYLGGSGHRLKNIVKLLKIKNKEKKEEKIEHKEKDIIREELKKNYLTNAKPIKEVQELVKKLYKIENIQIGVISKNYISEKYNVQEMIFQTLKNTEYPPFNFIKRINYKEEKIDTFKNIRNQNKEYIIISIGDEVGDYISGKIAQFDACIAIEGFDSRENFQIEHIAITDKLHLEEVVCYSLKNIFRNLIQKQR